MSRASDALALASRVEDARPTYRFETADGVCSKESFRPAELLLVEELWDRDPGHLLVPEANYGVVPTVLANQSSTVHAVESSARAARLCEHNAARNDADVTTSVVADLTTLDPDHAAPDESDHATPDDPFDAAAYAPKPYTPLAVGCQRIADALSVLRPGGSLFVAASQQTGRARYEDCLREVAGTVEHRRERDGVYLLEATRPASPDAASPSDAWPSPDATPPDDSTVPDTPTSPDVPTSPDAPTYVTPRTLRPTVDGTELALVTVPGLFAASGLDDGTRLLLEAATVADGDHVLDLCCGYGAVGAYVASVADCDVWLTDDDRVATRCAECSLRAPGVEGTVVTADALDGVADRTFDHVLCNPPTHAGDGVLDDLFSGVGRVLAPGGEALVVHHRGLDLRSRLSRVGPVERRRTGDEHVVVAVTG